MFKVATFDSNSVADNACKEIFKAAEKKHLQAGNISKRNKKHKQNINKDKLNTILQNGNLDKKNKYKNRQELLVNKSKSKSNIVDSGVTIPNTPSINIHKKNQKKQKISNKKLHKDIGGTGSKIIASEYSQDKKIKKQRNLAKSENVNKYQTASSSCEKNNAQVKFVRVKQKKQKLSFQTETRNIHVDKSKNKNVPKISSAHNNFENTSKNRKQSVGFATLKYKKPEMRKNKVGKLIQGANERDINAHKQKKRKRNRIKALAEDSLKNTKEVPNEMQQNKAPVTTVEQNQTRKRQKRKQTRSLEDAVEGANDAKKVRLRDELQKMISNATDEDKPRSKSKPLSLRQRMMQKLQSARFRYINEQIYSTDSKEAQKLFSEDPDAFNAYHEGYRHQVNKWPLNPLDNIIKSVQKLPKTHIVADFGCGDAKLAKSVKQKVHSFDLVAVNEFVQACDMAHVPLNNESVDIVVFCLSLMGTNLHDYILEANRVLKVGGILKVAEIESRFEDVKQFIEGLQRFHFKNTWKDLSHNLFYFMDFKKEGSIKSKKKLPTLSLHPCLYKKR